MAKIPGMHTIPGESKSGKKKSVSELLKALKNRKSKSGGDFDDFDFDDFDFDDFDYGSSRKEKDRQLTGKEQRLLSSLGIQSRSDLGSLRRVADDYSRTLSAMARHFSSAIGRGESVFRSSSGKFVSSRRVMEKLNRLSNLVDGYGKDLKEENAARFLHSLQKSQEQLNILMNSSMKSDIAATIQHVASGSSQMLLGGGSFDSESVKKAAKIYAKEISDSESKSFKSGQYAKNMTLLVGAAAAGPLGVAMLKMFGIDRATNRTIQNLTLSFLGGTGKVFKAFSTRMSDAWSNSSIGQGFDFLSKKFSGEDADKKSGSLGLLGAGAEKLGGLARMLPELIGSASSIIMPILGVMAAWKIGAVIGQWLSQIKIGGKSIGDWVSEGFTAMTGFFDKMLGINPGAANTVNTGGLLNKNLAGTSYGNYGVRSASFRAHDFTGGSSDVGIPFLTGANNTKTLSTGDKISAKLYSDITGAASRAGIDPSLMFGLARSESSFGTDVGSSHAGARGVFQLTKGAWDDTVKKHADLAGFSFDKDSGNAAKNSMVAAYYMKDTGVAAQADPAIAKLSYFLGTSGANKFLSAENRNPGAFGADLFPAAARANPSVFYNIDSHGRNMGKKTLADIHQWAANQMASTYLMQKKATINSAGDITFNKPAAVSVATPTTLTNKTSPYAPVLPSPVATPKQAAAVPAPTQGPDDLHLYVTDSGLVMSNYVGLFSG